VKSCLQLISALLSEQSDEMRKILRLRLLLRVLLFGLLGLTAFYLYLRWLFANGMKCFIPGLMQTDRVYVFTACR